MVCMWRMGAAKRPVQSVDVCRSTLSSNTVRCLTIWRTTYSVDLLAACLDVDDSQVCPGISRAARALQDSYIEVAPIGWPRIE